MHAQLRGGFRVEVDFLRPNAGGHEDLCRRRNFRLRIHLPQTAGARGKDGEGGF